MRILLDLNSPPPECTYDVYSEPVQSVQRGSAARSEGMHDEDAIGGFSLCKRNCSDCGVVRELPADVLEALEEKMLEDDREFVCDMAGYHCYECAVESGEKRQSYDCAVDTGEKRQSYDCAVDTYEKRQSSGTPVLSKSLKEEQQHPVMHVLKPVKVEQTQSDDHDHSGKRSAEECGSYADLQKMIEFLKKNSYRDVSVKEVVEHMGRPVVKLVAALEHLAEPEIKQMLVYKRLKNIHDLKKGADIVDLDEVNNDAPCATNGGAEGVAAGSTSPARSSNSCGRAQVIDDCRISCDACLSNNSDNGGGEVTLNGIFDEDEGRCLKDANELRGSETVSRLCSQTVCAGEVEREGGGSSMGPREQAGVCPEDFSEEAVSVARPKIRRKRVVMSSDDEDCREGINGRPDNSAPRERSVSPEADNQNAPGDWLCMICDDGGPLTQCDGCDRCVHLGGTDDDGNALSPCMKTLEANYKTEGGAQKFYCHQCVNQRHQCYICHKFGSSKRSKTQEMFRCNELYCGYFYHRKCLKKWARRNEIQELREWKIPFRCPVHHCQECRKQEGSDPRNPLIVCRRCPKAWHFKCLPKELIYAAETRVWGVDKDGPVASEPMLLYCLSHDLLPMQRMPPQYVKFELPAEVKPTKPSKKVKKVYP